MASLIVPERTSTDRLIPTYRVDSAHSALARVLGIAADRAAAALCVLEDVPLDVVRRRMHEVADSALRAATASHDAVGLSGVPAPSRGDVDALRTACLEYIAGDGAGVVPSDLARLLLRLEQLADGDAAPRSVPVTTFVTQLTSTSAVEAVVEIAHDMRSPLTSILFLVDTLRRGQSGPVTAVQERQLGLIYGAALGLSTLACDVIDAAYGGNRLVDGKPSPFSLADLVMGVCDTVRPISEEKGLPIHQTVTARDGRTGYPSALGRVLLNLLSNALKYTRSGSVAISCIDTSDARVEFSISDTGEGIPPHVLSMLFEGFRPTATGMRFSNAGLGLAICQKFLHDMGTSLRVDSAPGKGTRFSFELDLPPA